MNRRQQRKQIGAAVLKGRRAQKKDGVSGISAFRAAHAIRRARERYGFTVTLQELAHITARVLAGDCVVMGPSKNGREGDVVRIDLREQDVFLVFDFDLREVCTFLLPEQASTCLWGCPA